VLFAGIYYVLVEDYPKSGVALGLALLARPDFALWVAPAYAFLVIRNYRQALRAAALSAAIVGPWVIFTWIYYGSPIPNTITAKQSAYVTDIPAITDFGAWPHFLGDRLSFASHSWRLFAPFYEDNSLIQAPLAYGAAKGIALIVGGLVVIGALSTLRRTSWLPAIAYVALFAAYKVIYLKVGYFEWYGVPAVAVLVLVAAVGLDRLCKWLSAATRDRLRPAQVAVLPTLLLALAYIAPLPYRTVAEHRIQAGIEDKVRDPLGRYLGEVVKPGETIGSESSGYVGYYTNATLYDYPGLESPTVVSALDKARESGQPVLPVVGVAHLLHPDWLVLRPVEARVLAGWYPDAARQYTQVRSFSAPGDQEAVSVRGFDVTVFDGDFIVFRRNP
jgi:hypothetical protein